MLFLKNSVFLHGMRVAVLSFKLCRKLKLNAKRTFYIFLGAVLHDIGKFKIDKAILNKPDSLNEEEFKIIKTHVNVKLRWIKNSIVKNIILYHHENIDGTGYKGLTYIPYEAKIVRICDIFDALTHDRVYHKKVNVFEALKIMIGEINKLDYLIMDSFIRMILCNKSYKCNYSSCLKKSLNNAR